MAGRINRGWTDYRTITTDADDGPDLAGVDIAGLAQRYRWHLEATGCAMDGLSEDPAVPGSRFLMEDPERIGDGRLWSRSVKSREFRSRTAPHPMPHPRGQWIPPSALPRAVSGILRNAS